MTIHRFFPTCKWGLNQLFHVLKQYASNVQKNTFTVELNQSVNCDHTYMVNISYCTSTPEANWATKSPEVIHFLWATATKATNATSGQRWATRASKKSWNLLNFMQITMTRFSGKTLTANRNVDALRLRGSQGTPAGTLVPTYLYSLTVQNVGWIINRGCNWAPGVVRPNPFSLQRSQRQGSGVTRGWLVWWVSQWNVWDYCKIGAIHAC